jgi:hypothetical protein
MSKSTGRGDGNCITVLAMQSIQHTNKYFLKTLLFHKCPEAGDSAKASEVPAFTKTIPRERRRK